MLSMKSEVLHFCLRTNCISCITTASCSQKTGKESRRLPRTFWMVAASQWVHRDVAVKGTRKQGNERERERGGDWKSRTGSSAGTRLICSYVIYRRCPKCHPMTITSCWLEKWQKMQRSPSFTFVQTCKSQQLFLADS